MWPSSTISALAGTRRGPWSGAIAGEWNTTEGAIPVAPEIRGPIDTPAGVESSVLSLSVGGAITRMSGAPRVRSLERAMALLVLCGALPGVGVALWLLFRTELNPELRWTLAVVVVGVLGDVDRGIVGGGGDRKSVV